MASRALGYAYEPRPYFGLHAQTPTSTASRNVVLVHGTSRADKEWPFTHWVELGQRLQSVGYGLTLTHGNPKEHARAQRLADALPGSQVWPALSLDEVAQRMAQSAGVIGVDSGLSHLAVALDLPHVQLYNFDTAWRTGPLGAAHQQAVYAQPVPTVDQVWRAWQACCQAHVMETAA